MLELIGPWFLHPTTRQWCDYRTLPGLKKVGLWFWEE